MSAVTPDLATWEWMGRDAREHGRYQHAGGAQAAAELPARLPRRLRERQSNFFLANRGGEANHYFTLAVAEDVITTENRGRKKRTGRRFSAFINRLAHMPVRCNERKIGVLKFGENC